MSLYLIANKKKAAIPPRNPLGGKIREELIGNVYPTHVLIVVIINLGNREKLAVLMVCKGFSSCNSISTGITGLSS